MSYKSWDNHYKRTKSQLFYPDENLVRLIKSNYKNNEDSTIAIDLGCGSGRHLVLLKELGFKKSFGLDISFNALDMVKQNLDIQCVQNNNTAIPLKDNSVEMVVAWGSLHYATKDTCSAMIKEIHRILKSGGHLLGTLRSDRDTYLKKGKHIENNTWITDLDDIDGSTVSFYKEEELKQYLDIFSTWNHGYIERSIIGDSEKIISHWVIDAVK